MGRSRPANGLAGGCRSQLRSVASLLRWACRDVHGDVRLATGEYPAAAQALEQALGIYRDLGDRSAEATALNERGTLYRASGDLARAEGCHQLARELARDTASPWDEAHALAGLGRCALAAGHAPHAGILLRQALKIFQRIGAAEAPDLLAELDALTGPPPAR